MHLLRIEAINFRNLSGAIEFSPSLNVIHGPNAQGKSSWLEAIYLLATTKSFRTSHPRDTIRHQAQETISIPLAGKSSIADHMVIASGRSSRQVASMATKLAEKIKQQFGRVVRPPCRRQRPGGRRLQRIRHHGSGSRLRTLGRRAR